MSDDRLRTRGSSAEVTRRTTFLRAVGMSVVAAAALVFGGALAIDSIGGVGEAAESTSSSSTTDVAAGETAVSVPAPPILTDAQLVSSGEAVIASVGGGDDLVIVNQPVYGSATVDGAGYVTYAPDPGFVGTDRVGVEACAGADSCASAAVVVEVTPDTSRLVSQQPERILDTRGGDVWLPGRSVRLDLPEGRTAAALSVTLMEARQEGAVTIDGGGGAVTAIRVGGAGAMTTNTVVVPIQADTAVWLQNQAGGHLVVDLVGSFETAPASASGRYVEMDPLRVASHDTALEGREWWIDSYEFPGVAVDEIGAMLLLVTADIGADGGVIRFGADVENYSQMLMWAPPTSEQNQRRGVVLVTPGDEGRFAFRYEGGSHIDVDLLGYFTNDRGVDSSSGLYVPSIDVAPVSQSVAAGDVQVAAAPADAHAAFVSLSASPGVAGELDPLDLGIASGRTLGTVLDAYGGHVVAESSTDLDVQVEVLGVFVE